MKTYTANKNTSISEKELVKKISSSLKSIFSTDLLINEFSAGYGIADLVFAKNFLTKLNHLNRIPINNYFDLMIYLSFDENSSMKARDIQNKFSGLSISKIYKSLQSLNNSGYIYKDENQFFYKEPSINLENPIKKVIAIEAKLTDYKSGIVQAKRYQYFADECYLAILEKSYKHIDINVLKNENIGLIICDESNGNINLVNKPTKNRTLNKTVNIFAKELILENLI